MPVNETAGTVFIRQNTFLPPGLIIETEAFLPGWRAAVNGDGGQLARTIEKAKWNFFSLAGELKSIVLGRQGSATFRRALCNILANPEARKFNSLEIRGIRQRWFLGIPFVIVTANFRHIQHSLVLNPANDATSRSRVTPDRELAATGAAVLISSS